MSLSDETSHFDLRQRKSQAGRPARSESDPEIDFSSNSGRTALVLFTLTPRLEANSKRIGVRGSRSGRVRLFEALIAHTRTVLSEAGCGDVVLSSPEGVQGGRAIVQVGDSFAERFTHTITELFARGYERVVVVGNDCPTLTPALIRGAVARIEGRSLTAVLGPARDGGFYLLGLDRRAFDSIGPAGLRTLPWGGSTLASELVALISRSGSDVPLLQYSADLDDDHDLECLAVSRSNLPRIVRASVARLVSGAIRGAAPSVNPPLTSSMHLGRSSRAPPGRSTEWIARTW